MSDSKKRSLSARLTQLIPLITLLFLFLPVITCAETFLTLHNSAEQGPDRQASKRSLTIGLNENGDLMMRHRDASLIVAYNPPNDIIDYQERIRIAQRQDNPVISGISIKITLLF